MLNLSLLHNAAGYLGHVEKPGPDSDPVILDAVRLLFPEWDDDSTIAWCSNAMTRTIPNISANLPRHATKRYPRRDLSDVEAIMIHHSADNHGPEVWAEWHVNGHGWPGIAYAFAVMPDGEIYQTTDWREMGYHCRGRNRRTIGVCLSGNFDKHEPTSEQIDAVVYLATHINSHIGRILPLDWHDHHRPTSCPGKFMPRQLIADRIRAHYEPPKPEPPEDDGPDDVEEPEPPHDPPPTAAEGCVIAMMAWGALVVVLYCIAGHF